MHVITARLAAAGLVAASLGSALAGCGPRAAQVALPPKAQHVRPAGHPAVRRSLRDLVVAAYEGYWRATGAALASRDPARARTIMSGYVPHNAIASLVRGLQAIWRRNEIGYGSPVFHIIGVTVTGHGTAAVHDCLDLSRTGLQNEQTGQIVGPAGRSHDFVTTTLALVRGRWLVTGAIPVVHSCAY